MRVALVEDVIHYTGSNGIHFHRCVVRKLLGSPGGMPLRSLGDNTTFSGSVDLKDLEDNLRNYLEQYEKDCQSRRLGFQFQQKLSQINPKQLGIVAFTQNDETKEILQASFAK